MYIKVHRNGELSLEDQENFGAFHIEGAAKDVVGPTANPRFAAMSELADENRSWLDAKQVVDLSGRLDDEEWVRRFWEMLAKAEPYGFADTSTQRIKAHLA